MNASAMPAGSQSAHDRTTPLPANPYDDVGVVVGVVVVVEVVVEVVVGVLVVVLVVEGGGLLPPEPSA